MIFSAFKTKQISTDCKCRLHLEKQINIKLLHKKTGRKTLSSLRKSQNHLKNVLGFFSPELPGPVRPIIVNYSFIVTRLHRKNLPQNATWKLIIWSRTKKKVFFPTIVKNTGSRNTLITGQDTIDTR